MSFAAYIHTGPWVNHSHGILLGATITLSTRDAALLVAFLTVVVTTAGASSWTILKFILHQVRSKGGAHDALFFQQQAILKNTDGALGAAWKLFRVSFSWCKHDRRKLWRSRTLLYATLALSTAAIFGFASIFQSYSTKDAGIQFLINSPNCGRWDFPSSDSDSDSQTLLKVMNNSLAAAAYARDCYGTDTGNIIQCQTYNVPQIPWTANHNASCPFANGTCLLGSTAAYEMDTGLLDSHFILGLNAKDSERVTVRKVSTCAPLHLSPYGKLVNQTLGGGAYVDEFIQIYIGPIQGGTNWTYEYNKHSFYVDIGYDLQPLESLNTVYSAPGWDPIPAFNRTDADVSVFFFAANSVIYTEPNTDPIFSATTPRNVNEQVVYISDFSVNVLGCADQYQLCNPGINGGPMRCNTLSSFDSSFKEYLDIGLNEYQKATIITLADCMLYSSMFSAVNGRGSSALEAQNTVYDFNQGAALPNNQWQIEIGNWFAVSMTVFQQALVEYASGPKNVIDQGGVVISPTNQYGQDVCHRQMIRNVSGYQNFSTLGVGIILIIGTILVILSSCMDILVGMAQKRLNRHHARLSWTSDGYLQLQRLAYEGAGYDNWENCADDIPVTAGPNKLIQSLGGLDFDESKDQMHPRLARFGKSISNTAQMQEESKMQPPNSRDPAISEDEIVG